jgi:hypothetical protein
MLLRRDLLGLRQLVYESILTSDLDPTNAAEFNVIVGTAPTIDDMDRALEAVLNPQRHR